MIRHFFTRQFLLFLAVGGTAAGLHWLARLLLSFWLPFSWAVVLAYAVGMLVAFLLNRMYVFPQSARPLELQCRDFVLINVAMFPMVWAAAVLINHLLKQLGVERHSEELAHAVAISLPVVATFLLYKFLAFKEPDHEQ
jgi:putative flippase GtrA